MKIVNEQQTAFATPKKAISSAPVLILYPKREPLVIWDSSPIGLGGHSMVINHYASRTRTDTERRYSQIDISYTNVYLLGGNYITIAADHKPLLPLFNNLKDFVEFNQISTAKEVELNFVNLSIWRRDNNSKN
jgi:hypothetical protein